MSYTVPMHPYARETRVHHITENDPGNFTLGTARVVDAHRCADGTYLYDVHHHDDTVTTWPSFETIPAGLWRTDTERPPAP